MWRFVMKDGFRNRSEAGRVLARELKAYAKRPDVLVVGLPRGGVVTAFEIARELSVPLEVFIVRKLGVPQQKELAMGAIAEGGFKVINSEVVRLSGVSDGEIEQAVAEENRELLRRQKLYRGQRDFPPVKDKTVIVADDGLATGATMLAAVKALRARGVGRIVAAVPVGAADSCEDVAHAVDEMVCLLPVQSLGAVGEWYEAFEQTSDGEVLELLSRSRQEVTNSN